MTSYTPNIPQPGDDPSDSQDQILQNFQTINSMYGEVGDHYPFTNQNPTEGRRHARVTLPGLPTANIPGNFIPTPTNGDCALFGITRNSQTTPFLVRDGLASPTPPDFDNLWPVMPIKAFATFEVVANAAPPQNQNLLQSFNFISIIRTAATTFTFNIRNAMRSDRYGILYFASVSGMNINNSYSITTNLQFTITATPTHGAFVTVVVLEP